MRLHDLTSIRKTTHGKTTHQKTFPIFIVIFIKAFLERNAIDTDKTESRQW